MNKVYNDSFQDRLLENKNDEKKSYLLKSIMAAVFILTLVLLVFLARSKAQGYEKTSDQNSNENKGTITMSVFKVCDKLLY